MKYTVVPLLEALNNCSGTGAIAFTPEATELSQSDVGAETTEIPVIEDVSSCTTGMELTPASSMHRLVEISLPGTPVHSDDKSSSPSIASANRVEFEADIDELSSVEEEDETTVKV